MISRLRMSNFRRHGETELHFPDEGQLVLFAGENGAGKSTLVEAIVYSLYGEGRYGKSNLDKLVRRGAELEGMETELDFDREGVEYSVRRRRDSKKSTAVLYANGEPIMEGANQVSAEIGRILGMDSKAFKLAVLAQQKELEGLASLRAGERAAQLSRLLRLDAISKARDEARTVFRREKEIVNTLSGLDDIDELAVEVHSLRETLTVNKDAEREANEALAAVDAEIALSAALDEQWAEAEKREARAEGGVTSARSEVARLLQDLERIVIPAAVPAPSETAGDLTAESVSIERRIAQGEAAEQARSQRSMLESELGRAVKSAADMQKALAALPPRETIDSALAESAALLKDLREEREHKAESLIGLRELVSQVDTEAKLLKRQLDSTSELGAECDRCGQEISEEHRHDQVARLAEQVREKEAEVAAITKDGKTARDALAELDSRIAVTEEKVAAFRANIAEYDRVSGTLDELDRRRSTYEKQIERLHVPEVDLDELYAQKADIAVLLTKVQQAAKNVRDREAALTRKLDLDLAVTSAKERLVAAEEELVAARIGADLERAYSERKALKERRTNELELAYHWRQESAITQEKLTAAQNAHEKAERALERRRGHEAKAQAAANAARVLAAVEDQLNTQIRPALEGSVSEVLSNLSEGRFSSVRVDQDYNITVSDDGQFSDLTELSGGEKDLVALSVRLALASVVADRHGGGVGFLILDECMGSQDTARRGSILSVLRGLRSTYGQIFLISHIPGIEDEADVVVEVELIKEDDIVVSEARIV